MLDRDPGVEAEAPSRARLARAAGLFTLGALLSCLGMIQKAGVELRGLDLLLVMLGVPLASSGLLGLVVPPPNARAADVSVPARTLLPGLGCLLAALFGSRALLHAALAGRVPRPGLCLGAGVPALAVLAIVGALRCAEPFAADPAAARRPLWQRAWLPTLVVVVFLPALGSFGMIDPWEPEYAEVAREMLTRHDWISLWWGDQGWFWSKPILDFWLQGISFSWFGLDPTPGAMLGAVALGRAPVPEWAARAPIAAMALAGQFVLHRGGARHFGRRAATLGSLVLLSCPYWFFLARQTMVDMTYAAPLAAALGFLLLAGAPSERVRSYRIELGRRAFVVSARELTLFVIAGLSLLQVFYLLSRHVSLDGAALFFHVDRVWSGSPGNCTLPGNAPCALDESATRAWPQPGLAALAWAVCLVALLWRERREQTTRGLYYLAAWVAVALAVMGKAAPGLVLPLASFVGWLALRGELGELLRAKLPSLLLLLACVTAPWFVQEYARHGDPFFERLFLYDMVQRAFGHVHDTNAGIDTSFRYYAWQLGYGLFPWSGVAAAALLHALGRSAKAESTGRSGSQLLVAWQLACFGLFSIAGTKFHHYILPLVPAAAMLAGAWLAELWAQRTSASAILGLLAAGLGLLAGIDLCAPGDMPGAARLHQLFTYEYSRPWPEQLDFRFTLGVFAAAAALPCVGLALGRAARRASIIAISGVGVAFALWAIDDYLIRIAPHWSQRDTIAVYYSTRRSADELLVAYRQNWMGENFYTANHVATFKSSGQPFIDWIAQQRREGHNVLFFTTEHRSVQELRRELGQVAHFDLLTTSADNNKFVLARVEL